jgi:hypothetical protein
MDLAVGCMFTDLTIKTTPSVRFRFTLNVFSDVE